MMPNCGTGSLAAIGIILRDLFGSIKHFQAFEDAFTTSSMVSVQDPLTGKYTCWLSFWQYAQGVAF